MTHVDVILIYNEQMKYRSVLNKYCNSFKLKMWPAQIKVWLQFALIKMLL